MGPVQQTKLRTCIQGHEASSTKQNSGHVFRVMGPVQQTNSGHVFRVLGPVQKTKLRTGIQCHGASSTNKTQDMYAGHGAGSTNKTQDIIQGHGAGSTSKTQDMYSGSWAMLLLKRQIFVLAREIAVDLLGNNRRSSEIQGTALGKSLPAWTCIYIYIDRDCYYIYIGPCLRV